MRNNKGRADTEMVGTGVITQVDEILKCSEPFHKYQLSWAPDWPLASFSLLLPALGPLWPSDFMDLQGDPRISFQINSWWPLSHWSMLGITPEWRYMQTATVGRRGESPLWLERCESYKIGMASQRRELLGHVLKSEGIGHQMDFIGNTYPSARKRGPYNDMELAQWVLDTKSLKRATKRGELVPGGDSGY